METQTEEFIKLINQSVAIAEQMRSQSGQSQRLNNVINVLQSVKNKVMIGQLEPSAGNSTLGLSREVADWIETLDAPLLKAVGAVEAYYQQHF
ncbi:hypothetical protein CLI64_02000 [Nostoc sp. CENA543]|uniref:hypothetical protein n=1 Tax=Nostoc sp. CENA543 TaxID=1869241 RepID=UPI000CA1C17F|nr:hypothetical protein [Nostoc sp. CENA543]AUS99262.1 hypothetical protein CLI64_02000 [Nostoc sp. CENA543]